APFNVRFTTERPKRARYTMVLIGGKGSDLGYSDDMTGLGRVDCDNHKTDEIVFVFPGEAERTPFQAAAIIAHELGHSFGLAHNATASDLMFPAVGSLGQTFEDAESRLVRPGTCGRSVQNSFRLLVQTLGLRASAGVRGFPSPSPA